MIAQLDHNIGRILDALAARGLADDTLVVFTGDHGDFMGDHQMMLKAPIHYEALVRVPLIVRGPGFAGRAAVVDDPVGTIDLAPTALAACGVPNPRRDGRPAAARRSARARAHRGRHAARQLRLPDADDATLPHHARRGRAERGELYDLADDPGELTNRWDDPALRDGARAICSRRSTT